MELLNRNKFRESVFERDKYKCVLCQEPAQDAHHIMERRLFPDGGYFLDNGASVCGPCHLLCESTEIEVEDLLTVIGVKTRVTPPHLYPDQRYDKWGNPINQDGTRAKGELYDDPSVQKILGSFRTLFNNYVKYPRTYHLPWSPGQTRDDRVMTNYLDNFSDKEVVITTKMDGECTTMYADYIHARSLQGSHHPSQSWVRNLHAQVCADIPHSWRLCGENLFAKHSILYEDLDDYFLMFSVWDESNYCLSWDETEEWAQLLGLKTVPILFRGVVSELRLESFQERIDTNLDEGFVIRLSDRFHYSAFKDCVAKWVRPGHSATTHNWKHQAVVQNSLKTI